MSRIATNRRKLKKIIYEYAQAQIKLACEPSTEHDRAVLAAFEKIKRCIADLESAVRSNERDKWI